MKKSWYWLAGILVMSAISCNGQPAKTEEVKAEVTANSEQVARVGDNVSGQSPVHIGKADFLRLVMDYEKNTENWVFKGEKPCLIDFYADWCAPCRITSPILEDLAKQYAGQINIYKVDVDAEQELAAVFGVQSIPTFLFCPMEGKPTISSGIANSPEATRDLFIQQIEELLLMKENPATL
ncbi:MAG: thiol reductase thioredoxin [Bacteroidales bacterium]|nr:thiol reductase thioredoxin [Bacteroidales bacterium]